MRPLYLLIAYFSATILLGSVLAYLVFALAGFDYLRVLSRSIVLAALLCLWPLIRTLKLQASDIGWQRFPLNRLLLAWCLGVGLILPVIIFFVSVGFRVRDDRVVLLSLDMAGFLGQALLSGVLVALVEETIFRGVVVQMFRGAGIAVAATVSSLIYAAVHFIEAPVEIIVTVGPFSGVGSVLSAFAPLGSPGQYWDSFVALFLLGLALCWIRHATGSLLWVLGLHAAFVTSIRVMKELTVRDIVNEYAWLVGDYDHFVGLLVAFWLVLLLAGAGMVRRAAPSVNSKPFSAATPPV